MKMRRCYTVIFGLSLLHSFEVAAGLSLSDAPMFITEVLAPNVIISPAYRHDANETAMKDTPWDCYLTPERCAADPAVLKSYPWTSSAVFAPDLVYRVTPWPSMSNNCYYDVSPFNDKMACTSRTSVDTIYFTDIIPAAAGAPEENRALDYKIKYGNPADNYPRVNTFHRTEELYPEADVAHGAHVDIYNEALTKYVRSDSNFLYYNPSVALLNGGKGYIPWPSLGVDPGLYSPIIYDGATAKNPYYNPLRKVAAGQAVLDVFGSTFVYGNVPGAGAAIRSAMNVPYFIGQYYTSNGGVPWNADTYTRHTWDVGGDANKVNFANWFTYWRSSYLASRGMLSQLLYRLGPDGADILDKFRLGIPYRDAGGINVRVQRVTPLTDDEKTGADPVGARKAKNYEFQTKLASEAIFVPSVWSSWSTFGHSYTHSYFQTPSAYKDNPGAGDAGWVGARSCRRNYEIILTPDYTTLTDKGPEGIPLGNIDGASGAPYADNSAARWGDVGMYGWATDLVPELPNNLLKGKRDEATWQHLVRYVVGPTAKGRIFNTPINSFDDADAIFQRQNAATWPTPPQPPAKLTTPDHMDDIWHMALNSRGFVFTSDNIVAAVDNMLNAFNDILVRNVSGSAVATNTSSLSEGGMVYQATVESDWKGHLRAYQVKKENNADNKPILDVKYGKTVWDLAEKVSAQNWDDREIATYNGGGVRFRWDNLSAVARTLLKENLPAGIAAPDVYGGKMVEYLRGSGECEDGSGNSCVSGVGYTFRRRNIDRGKTNPYTEANPNGRNVLGDIANSNPWVVSPPVAGPSDVDLPGYNAHRVAMKNRPKVLYVGANDGMLHAVKVDDAVDASGSLLDPSGVEALFAYVPSFVHYRNPGAVIPCTDARNHGLQCLASASYAHRFFVDGSPFTAEVDLSGNGAGWKTVLAGGANKGGKGYYLLDVTSPTTNTEDNAATWVLWEFTHPELYYSFNMPAANALGQARQIARMNDNRLALIVGNGYPEESAKQACLFIIYLTGPTGADKTWIENTDYRKLCAGVADYTASGGLDTNGLSTPTPYDTNGDGKVDVIYAGDLNGNMWRFDVGSTLPIAANGDKNWKAAYFPDPLFVAKNAANVRQPIITPPEVTSYLLGTASGQLVLFGTGKYIENSDRANTDVQSFYGVWDRGLSGIVRANLFEQSYQLDATITPNIRKQDNKPTPTYCTSGADPAACTADAKHLGWYWDMPTVGERLTGKMNLINGVVLFNTFYPATEIDNGVTRLDPCQYGGDGWLMGLNAVNGYMEDRFPVFDTNLDGVVDPTDTKAAGVKVGAAIGGAGFAKGIGDTKIGIFSPTALGSHAGEGKKMRAIINTGTVGTGRVSWFELLD